MQLVYMFYWKNCNIKLSEKIMLLCISPVMSDEMKPSSDLLCVAHIQTRSLISILCDGGGGHIRSMWDNLNLMKPPSIMQPKVHEVPWLCMHCDIISGPHDKRWLYYKKSHKIRPMLKVHKN